MIQDTIVSLSTALTTQAVSIIRLSGDRAVEITEKLIQKSLINQDHRITYGFVHEPLSDIIVDEVIVLVMKGPRSYTREDIVEIQCHGGVYITQKILGLVLGLGARLAYNGEFTQRAVMNGRIDLSQAESINELVYADSEQSAQLAIAGLKGSLKTLIDPLKEELLGIIAHIEVNIDYPEYDIEEMTRQTLLPLCIDFKDKLEVIVQESKSGIEMKNGIKTAIIGKPNVGKSSLLNALLNEDKAIVTDIPGTTRDVVEGTVRLKNVSLHLLDTAGIRQSDDVVEKLGIDKTYKMIDEAELILFLVDAQKDMDEEEKEIYHKIDPSKVLLVHNKSDLASKSNRLEISAMNKDIKSLIDVINERYEPHQFVFKRPVLSTQRTIGLAIQALVAMNQAIESIELENEIDLINIDLREAYQALHAIGSTSSDTTINDEIFSRFCLGK
jgi:tRNA modification GTPase